MTSTAPDDWSPADNPYAIAVSEAQWWRNTALLAIKRMRADDDHIGWMSTRQIDARQLIFALRQLLTAEQLEQVALAELRIDPKVGDALAAARQRFEDVLPGVKHIRDGLMHFDEWSRGEGKFGPQRDRRRAGDLARDIAREYWSFGYDPTTGVVSFGPYSIHIDAAEQAASQLCDDIYMAAREVDKKNTAARRARTIAALNRAGLVCDEPESLVQISPGADHKIWVSLRSHDDAGLAERVVSALAADGLQLMPTMAAADGTSIDRLLRSEPLFVEDKLTSSPSSTD
jgi:hypothetical protein